MAEQFLDLTPHVKDVIGGFFPSTVKSQTVGGKLVALPWYATIPGLYYRKDLLEKHGKAVPKTWAEMAATAKGDPGQGARRRQRVDVGLPVPGRAL